MLLFPDQIVRYTVFTGKELTAPGKALVTSPKPGETINLEMKNFVYSAILILVLLMSCAGRSSTRSFNFTEIPAIVEDPYPYNITDYRNRNTGGAIPEWVYIWLDSGFRGIEALGSYQDRFVFVARNEGSNFAALNQWLNGFSPGLDFPRMAAARIEARFNASVPFPDEEYGTFYETLIRAASDSPWAGAVREDDFWIKRLYSLGEDEDGIPQEREAWDFLILVTIEKNLFASQLETVFANVRPRPSPTRNQNNAANRVKDNFFEGF